MWMFLRLTDLTIEVKKVGLVMLNHNIILRKATLESLINRGSKLTAGERTIENSLPRVCLRAG